MRKLLILAAIFGISISAFTQEKLRIKKQGANVVVSWPVSWNPSCLFDSTNLSVFTLSKGQMSVQGGNNQATLPASKTVQVFKVNRYGTNGASLTIEWLNGPSVGVTSYIVYMGNSSRNYERCLPVGNTNNACIDGLDMSLPWYFSVTALNEYTESDFSNEVNTLNCLCAN